MQVHTLVDLAVKILNKHYHPRILSIPNDKVRVYLERAKLEKCQSCETFYPKNYHKSHINCLQTRILRDYERGSGTDPHTSELFYYVKPKKNLDSQYNFRQTHIRKQIKEKQQKEREIKRQKLAEAGKFIMAPPTLILTPKIINYIKTHPIPA